MVKNAEEEVGLDVVLQDSTSNPDVVLLRTTVLGELPCFRFAEETFICYDDPLLVLLQDVLLKSRGGFFRTTVDGRFWVAGHFWVVWLAGFLKGNSTSHMRLHFHVLEEGVVKSTVKLQFGPVADDMLEGGKPAIYGFMMAVM